MCDRIYDSAYSRTTISFIDFCFYFRIYGPRIRFQWLIFNSFLIFNFLEMLNHFRRKHYVDKRAVQKRPSTKVWIIHSQFVVANPIIL